MWTQQRGRLRSERAIGPPPESVAGFHWITSSWREGPQRTCREIRPPRVTSSGRVGNNRFDLFERLTDLAPSRLYIVSVLQIQPKLSGGAQKTLPRRSAVSALIPVVSATIRSIRVGGRPHFLASAPADRLSGIRNSSRTSPGCKVGCRRSNDSPARPLSVPQGSEKHCFQSLPKWLY